jgi:predicted O-methyltransferase YrrM
MNDVLQEILRSGVVTDDLGRSHPLRGGISQGEGRLIQTLIRENAFSRGLETGCGFGISGLYICEALSQHPSPSHTIIDPPQRTEWHGIGMSNRRRAAFDFVEFIEKPSEIALPALLAQGRSFNFALIDGWHTFDHTLLDFFYVNRLLVEGGIVVIDDLWMPAVEKVLRYVLNYPHYQVVACLGRTGLPRRTLGTLTRPLVARVRAFRPGGRYHNVWNRDAIVALRKVGPDPRGWNWYRPF